MQSAVQRLEKELADLQRDLKMALKQSAEQVPAAGEDGARGF